MERTLVIVDVQYDFLQGGSLAVGGADASYVAAIEAIRPLFDQIVLTADNHPKNHVSFSIFPPHCVAHTHGAQLAVSPGDLLLLKGEQLEKDEFSAFSEGENVDKIEGKEIYVLGLAGDYCVKQTILDLLQYAPKKRIFAITDLIHSVDGTEYVKNDPFNGKVTFITSTELESYVK